MSWLDDRGYLEGNLMYVGLPAVEYSDNRSPLYSGESEEENFVMPTFFAVSPDYHNFRVGLSFTAPGGLSKQWKDPYPRTFSEEFSLKVLEFSPSVSYKISDMISVAAGVRAVYADGKVKTAGMISREYGGVTGSMDLEGDTLEWGYNFAATVRPVKDLSLSLTYRSNVDLGLEGDAKLATSASFAGMPIYNGSGEVEVPLPAVLSIAAAYTFMEKLTVELEWDRTFWSEYEQLDFNYDTTLTNPFLFNAFDAPKPKNWEDTDAWRLGLSYQVNPCFMLMAGLAIDENPFPEQNVGFELPDSDAMLYSVGFRYAFSEDLDLGFGYLYDTKDSRSVSNSTVNGTFDGAGAHLVSIGLSYKL
jgi:long-chain fatty acid transport protein